MEVCMIERNERFLSQLKRHEGLELEAYRCPAGFLTIGWGHNVEARPGAGVQTVGDALSRGTAEALLYNDVKLSCRELDKAYPWWRSMSEARQGVLLNMHFNMGMSTLKTFKLALAAMECGDWSEAGRQMLASRWAGQVKGRAAELARQMVLGEWE